MKKADTLDVPFDMSDEAIERRWRDVAQLYRLGRTMKSARFTGERAEKGPQTSTREAELP